MSDALKLTALKFLLRVSAVVLCLAFAAVLFPVAWMERGHALLDVGDYPESPMYEYLARSISMLYGFHGLLLWIVSGDLVRFRPVVTLIGVFSIFFGATMLAVDLTLGFPLAWALMEGASIASMGVVVLWLKNAIPRDWSRS